VFPELVVCLGVVVEVLRSSWVDDTDAVERDLEPRGLRLYLCSRTDEDRCCNSFVDDDSSGADRPLVK